MSLPDLVFSNQDCKTFSTYKLTHTFCSSLFSSFAEMLLSFTTENTDVSSAKSFTVDGEFSDESLI